MNRRSTALALLSIGLLVASVASVGIGAVHLSPFEIFSILFGDADGVTPQQAAVLTVIRAPRVVLGALVGAGLSVSGALMQGLFRNPLADPGLIGVSSGAALAAACVIVFGLGTTISLPIAAFFGGAAVTLLVARLARRHGQLSVETMLLAGIAVNAIAGAGTGVLVTLSNDAQLRSLTFWTMGSLGGATWDGLAVVGPALLVGVLLSMPLSRSLNALLLGEEEARYLGISIVQLKRAAIGLAAMMVGVSVALTGMIGFVGLVVPHLMRLWLGPDHRGVLPGAALLGAGLLVTADLAARTVMAPSEIPIGVVTTLLGGPFFLFLLARNKGFST
ncbi:MAG: iron ABC transporter permease [Myxococcota bacterium]